MAENSKGCEMIELRKDNSARMVEQALSFQRPERLPVFDSFWKEFEDNWRRLRNQPGETDIEDYYWNDLKVIAAREEFFPTRIGETGSDGDWVYEDDGWGRTVRRKPDAFFTQPVERLLKSPTGLDAIQFEPADMDMRYADFVGEVEYHRNKGRALFVKIGGPFIRSTFFRGEVELLMDLAQDEPFAKAVIEKVSEHLLQIGLESLKRAGAGNFGVWIYDDMCNLRAPMFSPATFERVFLPIYKRIVSSLKHAGARWVFLHCDGNLMPLLDLVVEAGIDGINPVEPAAGMNVEELMERYHGRLSLVGGLCNTHILPSGDADRIRRHVLAVADAGKNGGLVIGTHTVGPDVSVESYELYRQVVAELF